MKKPFTFIFICLTFTCKLLAQEEASGKSTTKPAEKKGWAAAERVEFITNCIASAKPGFGPDTARYYCYCMLEKVEKKFPVAKDADKLTAEELAKPEWKKLIIGCIAGTWSSETRSEFISSCIGSAKANMSEKRATNYCEFMAFKVEQAYPNESDLDTLDKKVFESTLWKSIIQDALNF